MNVEDAESDKHAWHLFPNLRTFWPEQSFHFAFLKKVISFLQMSYLLRELHQKNMSPPFLVATVRLLNPYRPVKCVDDDNDDDSNDDDGNDDDDGGFTHYHHNI